MNGVLTLDALAVPLRALRLLAVDFGHLPAPALDVSTIFPNRLVLSLHGTTVGESFAAFEQWRHALNIEPDAVDFHVQSGGRAAALEAHGTYGGADIELVAYAAVPQAADTGAGVAA
ncbi:hypothetical protein [Streptomyces sp. NBC_01506]|uniref:hypothetical protein n=1 Tax=Streptomyces sp. NBC_01506 TaxID=2903887 RepID=UPI0038684F4D